MTWFRAAKAWKKAIATIGFLLIIVFSATTVTATPIQENEVLRMDWIDGHVPSHHYVPGEEEKEIWAAVGVFSELNLTNDFVEEYYDRRHMMFRVEGEVLYVLCEDGVLLDWKSILKQ